MVRFGYSSYFWDSFGGVPTGVPTVEAFLVHDFPMPNAKGKRRAINVQMRPAGVRPLDRRVRHRTAAHAILAQLPIQLWG